PTWACAVRTLWRGTKCSIAGSVPILGSARPRTYDAPAALPRAVVEVCFGRLALDVGVGDRAAGERVRAERWRVVPGHQRLLERADVLHRAHCAARHVR